MRRMGGWAWKSGVRRLGIGLLCVGAIGWARLAGAQVSGAGSALPSAGGVGAIQITAEAPPDQIEWNGASGVLIRHAFDQEPERRMPLVYLHAAPGPKGYSQYLAWFLARDAHGFSLLWCYLNASGRDFWCWLYNFPSNQLTTRHFVGEYQFMPPQEPIPPSPVDTLTLDTSLAHYLGPDFTYRQWTRRAGSLARLDLYAPSSPNPNGASAPGANVPAVPTPPAGTPVKTLTDLKVAPLHELGVGMGNGWRAGGWKEMHAIATDAAGDPYYLILYDNATRGYVIDLKRGQTYTTDFGATVQFGPDSTMLGGDNNDEQNEIPELQVRPYERHEITLLSSETHANPYTDVLLEADITAPNNVRIRVGGFWDGNGTWRIRFTPTQVGTWTWRTRSNDTELNGKEGSVECVSADTPSKGFVGVYPSETFQHHFAYADGTPFYPVAIHDPTHHFVEPASVPLPSGHAAVTAALTTPAAQTTTMPATFLAFQKRVDACAALGINRFLGGYLLDRAFLMHNGQRNEGGSPFVKDDLDQLNAAYFQWMDRRIAYCNEKGIVPDLGIGWPDLGLFSTYSAAQVRRLWRYVVARYAGYNVCWNLFGRTTGAASAEDDARLASFADITRQFDPYHHPITTVLPDPPPMPAVQPPTPQPSAENADAAPPDDTAADQDTPRPKKSRQAVTPPAAPTGIGGAPWLDIITQEGTDLNLLSRDYTFNKPIQKLEPPAPVAGISDAARRRMWETRMRGGYWIGPEPADGQTLLTEPEIKWLTDCTGFFLKTRYWRLVPHPDMVGKPEDRRERRQRQRAEEEAARLNGTSAASAAGVTPAVGTPAAPIYVLADPGWEYVVYFTQGGSLELDLIEAYGRLKMEWFNPRTGTFAQQTTMEGGSYRTFTAPDANEWILYLSRR